MYSHRDKHCIYRCVYIALQVTPLHEAATGTQQDTIQHYTVANNVTDTQQSSVHQPTPQYALPNEETASNKDQEVLSKELTTRYITTYL